jgi:hypothetical protein
LAATGSTIPHGVRDDLPPLAVAETVSNLEKPQRLCGSGDPDRRTGAPYMGFRQSHLANAPPGAACARWAGLKRSPSAALPIQFVCDLKRPIDL